jgi:hypothetical protein
MSTGAKWTAAKFGGLFSENAGCLASLKMIEQ